MLRNDRELAKNVNFSLIGIFTYIIQSKEVIIFLEARAKWNVIVGIVYYIVV